MSESKKAIMFIFAGNNGSGKSTIRNLIIDRIGISVNIDPDALARRINPLQPETARVSAGKEAIRLARDCIRNHRDFSIETTLSGGYAVRLMQEARAKHFEITMFYVGLGDPNLNIERVANRVRNGGHHISSKDILHRHHSSIQNLLKHMDLVNDLLVIDNSALNGEIILEADNGRLRFQNDLLPDWVLPIRSQLDHP
ncbi:zeta toxin family protein [Paenibacillus sp. WQ 127069]|uniref:UDP-N-acetylglucosamine kinase n=1 Tax=Paenibacillus baimaensis TaxID=2982185 RepID=A0ABT2U7X0_9BACL|nr:zeta toxin family protein [Paenibacillus sp. WQ 127069]MCU6790730.1 zeta toxin family protein [Paenibacillus sp. WQ 127069]